MKFEGMPSRDINKLLPEARGACTLFLAICKQRNIPIFITQTIRTAEYQNYLYTVEHTTPLDGYKNKSQHQSGLAWDIAVSPPHNLYDIAILERAGVVAKELGIEWGGDYDRIDRPHFQIKKGQVVTLKGDNEVVEKKKMKINGSIKEVETIVKDGNNFVKLQDLKDWKISVEFDNINKIVVIDARA